MKLFLFLNFLPIFMALINAQNKAVERSKALKFLDSFSSQKNNCNGKTITFPLTIQLSEWDEFINMAVKTSNFLTQIWMIYNGTPPFVTDEFLYSLVAVNSAKESELYGTHISFEKGVYRNHSRFAVYAFNQNSSLQVIDLANHYDYRKEEWYNIHIRQYNKPLEELQINIRDGPLIEHLGKSANIQLPIVTLEDGIWSLPYYDCGAGDIWMVTFGVPIFTVNQSGVAVFSGVSGVDLDLSRIDINQCDLAINESNSFGINTFRGTHRCHSSTECQPLKQYGFMRGAYICICKSGHFFPNLSAENKAFSGFEIEHIHDLLEVDFNGGYNAHTFNCLPCPEGCESCIDNTPCMYIRNYIIRSIILILNCIVFVTILLFLFFLRIMRDFKIIKTASPTCLYLMCFGFLLMASKCIINFSPPTVLLCTLTRWLYYIGFFLAIGSLLLKTWRIAIIFKVKSAQTLRISDLDLLKRMVYILVPICIFLAVWTFLATPSIAVTTTKADKKYFKCNYGWWEFVIATAKCLFLLWGILLCFSVRKAPSIFHESTFISISIYNILLTSNFLQVIRLFLVEDYGPDLQYLMEMLILQVEVTSTACVITLPKLFIILTGRGNHVAPRVDGLTSSGTKQGVNSVYPIASGNMDLFVDNAMQNEKLCPACKEKMETLKY